jgi:hypothetical protein
VVPEGTPAQRFRPGLQRRLGIRFPPPNSPGLRPPHRAPVGRAVWEPQEEGLTGSFSHSASAARGYLPLLGGRVAIGQSPTEPCLRRMAVARAPPPARPVRGTAGAARFVGADNHYEPPANEAGAL